MKRRMPEKQREEGYEEGKEKAPRGAGASSSTAVPPVPDPHPVARPGGVRRASSVPPDGGADKKLKCAACDNRGAWGHGYMHSVECRKRGIESGNPASPEQAITGIEIPVPVSPPQVRGILGSKSPP